MSRSTFPPKRCGKCETTTHTRDAWTALAFVGRMVDEIESLELRNCSCGSTLAIVVRR